MIDLALDRRHHIGMLPRVAEFPGQIERCEIEDLPDPVVEDVLEPVCRCFDFVG